MKLDIFCDVSKTHHIWIHLENMAGRTTSISSRQTLAFEELVLCCLILKRLNSSSKILSSFKYSTDSMNTEWINHQSKIFLKYVYISGKNISCVFDTNL